MTSGRRTTLHLDYYITKDFIMKVKQVAYFGRSAGGVHLYAFIILFNRLRRGVIGFLLTYQARYFGILLSTLYIDLFDFRFYFHNKAICQPR